MNSHGHTGVKAWCYWCQTQFKDKYNLLSKQYDYLFSIALLLNGQMRSTLKTEIFHNPENRNLLSGNICVVIIDKQLGISERDVNQYICSCISKSSALQNVFTSVVRISIILSFYYYLVLDRLQISQRKSCLQYIKMSFSPP